MPLAERVGASVDIRVEDVAVRCGSGLLHIVVVNLVGNALKFLAGRPLRRVAVRARAVDGWCELVVADSGPGISADVLPRVFEPFYRAPGATEPGLGIGLATVKRVVTAYGGAIAVESVSGHGTTFRLRLPLHERPTAVPASGPAAAPDRVAT
jgi:signal transduction histidine kinase